jgi:hypothetical protein
MSILPKPVKIWEHVPVLVLYYYGARYLDPKTVRWLSADPAMGDYIPGAPVNDEARRNNRNLPGMGGVFNVVNLHAYHYAGNNPVKYTDPDGRIPEKIIDHAVKTETKQSVRQIQLSNSLQTQVLLCNFGYNKERAKNACVVLTLMAAVQDYTNVALSQDQVTSLLDSFYDKGFIDSDNVVQYKEKIMNSTLDAIYSSPFGTMVSPYKAEYVEGLVSGADYTERRGNTRSPPFSGTGHSQMGDGKGNFLHDPWSGGINRLDPTTEKIRGSIFFTKRENE